MYIFEHSYHKSCFLFDQLILRYKANVINKCMKRSVVLADRIPRWVSKFNIFTSDFLKFPHRKCVIHYKNVFAIQYIGTVLVVQYTNGVCL